MIATGLDSFYLKRNDESMSETMISEHSYFPKTQTTRETTQEKPNSNSGLSETFVIRSSVCCVEVFYSG